MGNNSTGVSVIGQFFIQIHFCSRQCRTTIKRIITAPELHVYVKDFGTTKDDFVLVSAVENKIIGAVWVRIMNDYGHINNKTPFLAISLYKKYRRQEIRSSLTKEMLFLLQTHSYKRISISIQKANYATKLYPKKGFRIIKKISNKWIMMYNLQISERT